MAEGEVRINTKLDTSGVDKGVKELQDKLSGAEKAIESGTKANKSFADSLKNISADAVKTVAGVAGMATAIKKTVDALDECAAAYRVQRNAEQSLQIAAKNNPYLNNDSIESLKNFASEMQRVSNIGDEASIKIMSQLAATGRTEEQIRSIMSAAADLAAVTGQDLASAAQSLNATLNGTAGTLGRQIESINNLTKAELESGKAIELVAEQYKGAAQATADLGTQLQNAWGDFKENIGRGWEDATAPVKEFFLGILNDINDAAGAANKLKEANKAAATGAETAAQALLRYQEADRILKGIYASKDFLNDKKYNEILNKELTIVSQLKARYNELAKAEKDAAQAAKEKAEADKRANDEAERAQQYQTYIDDSNAALEEQIRLIQAKADATGEEVDAGAMYNAYLNSYINLLAKSNGMVTADNEAAKERVRLMGEWRDKMQEAADAQQTLIDQQQALSDATGKINTAAGASRDSFIKLKKQAQDLYREYQALDDISDEAFEKTQEGNLTKFTKFELTHDLALQMQELGQSIRDVFSFESGGSIDNYVKQLDTIKKKYTELEDLTAKIKADSKFRSNVGLSDGENFLSAYFDIDAKKEKELAKARQEFLAALASESGLDTDRELVNFQKTTNSYDQRIEKINQVKEELERALYEQRISYEEYNEALEQMDIAREQANKDKWASYLEDATYYIGQVMDLVNQYTALMIQALHNVRDQWLSDLEKQYEEGELSEEEYYAKREEIKKQAAQAEYKMQMFQWTASLLAATANIAEGVTKAIATGGALGSVTGALVSAAGALQIATLMANKPKPPAFAGGGVIGGARGASMGADNTYIHARTGEMVLNASQQRALWDMIAAPSAQGGNWDLTVNNTQYGRVDTDIRQTREGLVIDILDKHINKGLTDGTYDGGFAAMNTRQRGYRIL